MLASVSTNSLTVLTALLPRLEYSARYTAVATPMGSATTSASAISIPVLTNAGLKVILSLPDSPKSKSKLMCPTPFTNTKPIRKTRHKATMQATTTAAYFKPLQSAPVFLKTGAAPDCPPPSRGFNAVFLSRGFFLRLIAAIRAFKSNTSTSSTKPVAIRACKCSPSA